MRTVGGVSRGRQADTIDRLVRVAYRVISCIQMPADSQASRFAAQPQTGKRPLPYQHGYGRLCGCSAPGIAQLRVWRLPWLTWLHGMPSARHFPGAARPSSRPRAGGLWRSFGGARPRPRTQFTRSSPFDYGSVTPPRTSYLVHACVSPGELSEAWTPWSLSTVQQLVIPRWEWRGWCGSPEQTPMSGSYCGRRIHSTAGRHRGSPSLPSRDSLAPTRGRASHLRHGVSRLGIVARHAGTGWISVCAPTDR